MVHRQLRLHKIASNDPVVVQAFEPQDLANDPTKLNFSLDELPIQRCLGLVWDLQSDSFVFWLLNTEERPFTSRGGLSHSKGLYGPLGIVSPIIVQEKLFLWEIMMGLAIGWDDSLSEVFLVRWSGWKQELLQVKTLSILRQYLPNIVSVSRHVCCFCRCICIGHSRCIIFMWTGLNWWTPSWV